MAGMIDQAKQFWASRTGRQRAFLLGGAGATALLITVFARLLSVPDYKPLFTNMEPADAQALASQLDKQNIAHQISPDGKTVSVPADKLDAARLQTASQGTPHSGRMGFEIFDKMTWGQTEFDEKVAYQRAMEGELERTIATLADVESARVHLVLPTDSVFLDRQREAKASVIVKLRRNSLSKEAVAAISRLVSGAVDDLKPEDVSIIDADSDRALGLGRDAADDGEGEEARLTQRLIDTLGPVVGANAIRASVNIDYDHGSTEENTEKYDPSVSALLSVQRNEDQAGSGMASGVAGTASNIPTGNSGKPASPTPAQNTQNSKSESAQYAVNRTVTHTIVPAGRIRRVTAALLVDDTVVKSVREGKVTYTRQKRTQDELNRIEALAQAAIGFDAKRGDSINVQNLSFESNSQETDVPAPTIATRVQKGISDYSAILRPVSLLALFTLAYLILLRPIHKRALGATVGMQSALPGATGQALGAGTSNDDSAIRAARLREEAFEMAKKSPLETARAMQAWLREDRG